jgi:hypothetical protein
MPVIAHISDGPVAEDIQRYHFGALDEPPVSIKFAKLPSGAAKWVRIEEDVPSVPWDVIYELASIRPIDTDQGDEVYAYKERK